MIKVVEDQDVTRLARGDLRLAQAGGIDDGYIAGALRRLAGFLCPCSPKTLLRSMVESHRGLAGAPEDFAARVEDVLEALVAVGDLLELRDVTTLDETVKATWVFAAPPSFVLRPSGSAYILGLAMDEATPLPGDLLQRLQVRGATRTIGSLPGEDLGSLLRRLSLRELSSEAWLRHPKREEPGALVAALNAQLDRQRPAGELAELRVLDGARRARSYRNRWCEPGSLTGRFIVRRPQAYGADLWAYAELDEGRAVKALDFPPPGSRWRGCDLAWRAQMAMDALNGDHQRYRQTSENGTATFDFFSPIPDWARRRLACIGEQVESEASLLCFRIPENEAPAEEAFLQEFLFLRRE
jgi:hypothetical protein